MPEEFYNVDTWKDLVQSDGWILFRDLMKEHIEFLNKQALLKIDAGSMEEAKWFRVRATECECILKLVDGRLAELKKKED